MYFILFNKSHNRHILPGMHDIKKQKQKCRE